MVVRESLTASRAVYIMDILNALFEQHFRMPVEQVQPLQGQLGGSGRKIIRLAGGKITAIGILYDGREENVVFGLPRELRHPQAS